MTTVEELIAIVGHKYVITNKAKSLRFRKGYRSGKGDALAVVFPGDLVELWKVLEVLHRHDLIIVMQASNTSLTEGSTPAQEYDREVVVVSGRRINDLQLINHGEQVLAFPGTTLFKLTNALKPFKREPHSVIGSSNLGASVIGGVSNNSGGALIRRGPAYTELALYARVDENNQLQLINHLGIDLGTTPAEMLTNLEKRNFVADHVKRSKHYGHFPNYPAKVRDIEANTPARFNANPAQLYEVSGSAGKVATFAIRLDTFPKDGATQVFYIGTNQPNVLEDLRRFIMKNFKNLPVSGEYMHREAYSLAKKYGKDSLIVIDRLGTSHLPTMFAMKATAERILAHFHFIKPYLPDRVLQQLGKLFPNQLPKRLEEFHDKYEHYLILKMADAGIQEAREFLPKFFKTAEGDYFAATAKETKRAELHRYVAAGIAIRYQELYHNDILPIDVALRRNEYDWFEKLPKEIDDQIEHKLYYGHFLDHVMHQDYILKPGVDPHELKVKMLKLLDKRGAVYPAEHNVGHLYKAAPALVAHYKELDPTNTFNPGVGKTTTRKYWGEK